MPTQHEGWGGISKIGIFEQNGIHNDTILVVGCFFINGLLLALSKISVTECL